ncbi:MAG: hypothetical protein JSW49_00770 [candidate division WOR-3 bacterium]|nr:MAG: hypothetical protein JSW49_00770 [candidate division WOR-3 bacterium]
MAKVLGYRYYIVEMFPTDESGQDVVSKILMYDNLESAQDVLDAMNRNNFNFSCYYILMDPVYERPRVTKEQILAGPDWEKVGEELPDPPF